MIQDKEQSKKTAVVLLTVLSSAFPNQEDTLK